MHKYLKAIGYSKINKRKTLQVIITDCIKNANERDYVTVKSEGQFVFVECDKDYTGSSDIGMAVRGEFDENNTYIYNYYFPYLRGNYISSYENITVERYAEKETYAGVCDDPRIGISLIFYLQNAIPYLKLEEENITKIKGVSLTLTGLSLEGTILMPIRKNEIDKKRERQATKNRMKLISEARAGDEEAIENLTMEDMDTYSILSKKIIDEDVFSLVDTYFMPYGVESDHYSIMAEIEEFKTVTNNVSGEEVYILTLNCNEMILEVCINSEDLTGIPEKGRRFKGIIWLQGYINFPS